MPETEIRPQFSFTGTHAQDIDNLMHHCGMQADYINTKGQQDSENGALRIAFCSRCLTVDLEAVQALSVAMEAFKASGEEGESVPQFQEIAVVTQENAALRAWSFTLDYASNNLDDHTFAVLVSLQASGAYTVSPDHSNALWRSEQAAKRRAEQEKAWYKHSA